MQRTGGVTEIMDASIGRSVTRIKGAVSANNHLDISGLALTGRVVYVQMLLIKPATATFHIDVLTASEETLRITFSTLYEQPRFISRTVRLPIPVRKGWMTLFFDLDRIMGLFVPHSGRPGDNSFKCIKVRESAYLHIYVIRWNKYSLQVLTTSLPHSLSGFKCAPTCVYETSSPATPPCLSIGAAAACLGSWA